MSPFRERRRKRQERERERRQARREELSARLRGERKAAEEKARAEAKSPAKAEPQPKLPAKAKPTPSAKAKPESPAKTEAAPSAKPRAKSRRQPKPKVTAATAEAAREARRAQRAAGRRSGSGDTPARQKVPRQRARRKARAARGKAVHSFAALAGRGGSLVENTRRAWRRGLRSSRARAGRAGPALRRAGGRAWALLSPLLAFVFIAAGRLDRGLRSALSAISAIVARTVARLDRLLTPLRGILVVTIACAACLVVSQFVVYHAVEIGQPGYVEVSSIASAPRVEVQKAGEAHSYLLVPLAALAVVMAAIAALGQRRRAGELVALAGLVGIAVTLLVDLPKGQDVGLAGSRFSGAHAVLTDGFYAQLAACAGLVICGVALSLNMREVRIPARRRARRERSGPRRRRPSAERRKAPSLAEGGT